MANTRIFPKRLQQGDEIRVISPSSSMERVGGFDDNLVAKKRLEELGFKVTFGANINVSDQFYSSSITERVGDLHAAFADANVKAILTTIGGLNSNELLPYLDWELIQNNPKLFIGYSDTTSLHNAIRAKTGLVTYYGPCYSAFKMNELQDYQSQAWMQSMSKTTYQLQPSASWSSDLWFDASQPRHLMPNQWLIYNQGHAIGTITGGNIQTYGLQAGTGYFPEVNEPIIFIEQAEEGSILEFSRTLAQILQLHPDIKALLIGRFPTINNVNDIDLLAILDKYPVLKTIPVLYHIDFGHTQPIFTFPLGGEVEIDTIKMKITITKG